MRIRHFYTTYFRNLRKHPFFTLVNILGLAIGMAGFCLIMMYVQFEFSYDKFNSKYDNIYRVEQDYAGRGQMMCIVHPAVGPTMLNDYPEVKNQTSFQSLQTTTILSINKVALINEQRGWLAGSSFFELFDYKVISGIKETFLDEPFSIVLSESTAQKLFNDEDPIGKTVRWDERFNCKVTGIVEDCPANSHISYNFFISINSLLDNRLEGKGYFENWNGINTISYLELEQNINLESFNKKIYDIFRVKIHEDYPSHVYVKPLSDLHFHSNVLGELGPRGDLNKVYVLIAIALLLLFIAIANFINLSTARASRRAKEVGLKKVVGVRKKALINQFIFEAFQTVLISLFISMVLMYWVLPEFSLMVDRSLAFDQLSPFFSLLFVACLVILSSLLAGSYPAFVLSSFSPIKVLKSSSQKSMGGGLRNVLVVFQFAISITLIISSLLIYKQTSFLKNKDLGFEKEAILNTSFRVHDLSILEKEFNFKAEILQNPHIKRVSISNYVPGFNGRSFATAWEGSQEGETIHVYRNDIDVDYDEMFGIDMVEGKMFSAEDFSDTVHHCLINEAAKNYCSWEEAVGKRFGRYRVLGVMKDFHFASLKEKIKPLIYFPLVANQNVVGRSLRMSIQYDRGHEKEVKQYLAEKYKSFFPNDVAEFWGFHEHYLESFQEEENIMKTTSYFSALAIFIACIGLLGLTSFIILSKNKEIGIRKVFGASSLVIVRHLLKAFFKWLLIANIIAVPLTYYFISNWLNTFPYHIKIGIWEFVMGSLVIYVVALLTVIFQSYKASLQNPILTLRYE